MSAVAVPVIVGMAAAAGVAVTYGVVRLFVGAGDVLVLIGLALFLAIGMEPAVSWLVKHRLPRWLGVITMLLAIVGVLGGFIAAAVPAVITQGQQLINDAPGYLQRAKDYSSFIGQLNDRFHLVDRLQSKVDAPGSGTLDGVLGGKGVVRCPHQYRDRAGPDGLLPGRTCHGDALCRTA